MSIRFKDVMNHLDFEELNKIKKDLESGSIHIKKLVERKITEKEKEHEINCSVCMNRLDPLNTNNFTLIFGRSDFKKKASFCGIDCLKYFLSHLESMKNQIHPKKE